MPVKKKVKKIKLKSMRGARASRPPTKKPNVKQTVNVYTTRAEPYRTDFRDQYRYGLGNVEREQTPFQPVFNYIQPQMPSMVSEPKKVEVEAKPKRTYTKKPVAVGVALAEPSLSRQSSMGGYESEFFMPSETEVFRQPTRAEESEVLAQRKIKKMEEELLQQPSSPEFFSGNISPVISEPKRKGRPVGSKSKPKEVSALTTFGFLPKSAGQSAGEPQLTSSLTQPDIMSFFGKTGGGSKTNE